MISKCSELLKSFIVATSTRSRKNWEQKAETCGNKLEGNIMKEFIRE